MENFRDKSYKRRSSCPLLITESNTDKFKIYDRDFMPTSVGEAPTTSGTPIERRNHLPSGDDRGGTNSVP